MKNLQSIYNSVKRFNEVAGNLDFITEESIDNQISYVWEEVTETIEAFEQGDSVGMLDGCCDVFVTCAGLMQKLEAAGYDVEGALKAVCENNMSKFLPVVSALDKGRYDVSFNKKYKLNVLKQDGKVKKPESFVSVQLAEFVPGDNS